ncbi:MAG: hypothetical protein M5R40_03610 [Anaerolineae bacterium]|nr:hypothetical protein [Anaerolineae bacterium]
MAAQGNSTGYLNGEAARPAWRGALLHALPVTAFVLYLFYYWFAVGDRYIVFLYNHEMGPYVPEHRRSAGSRAAATGWRGWSRAGL